MHTVLCRGCGLQPMFQAGHHNCNGHSLAELPNGQLRRPLVRQWLHEQSKVIGQTGQCSHIHIPSSAQLQCYVQCPHTLFMSTTSGWAVSTVASHLRVGCVTPAHQRNTVAVWSFPIDATKYRFRYSRDFNLSARLGALATLDTAESDNGQKATTTPDCCDEQVKGIPIVLSVQLHCWEIV